MISEDLVFLALKLLKKYVLIRKKNWEQEFQMSHITNFHTYLIVRKWLPTCKSAYLLKVSNFFCKFIIFLI